MNELVIENQIGVAKGTEVEKEVMDNFRGETAEVGLYLAMARQADREGFPEVARASKGFCLGGSQPRGPVCRVKRPYLLQYQRKCRKNVERGTDGQ